MGDSEVESKLIVKGKQVGLRNKGSRASGKSLRSDLSYRAFSTIVKFGLLAASDTILFVHMDCFVVVLKHAFGGEQCMPHSKIVDRFNTKYELQDNDPSPQTSQRPLFSNIDVLQCANKAHAFCSLE